ncbi:MAG TPA: hypothetical protein PKI93_03075 [Alphaproteobacteria bacterium]|nr:hypothetical protein [Alphaproteobacteria bacterium]HNS44816.1 hypothetical protein [Alphaproteobacteria bacterium]
MPKKIDFSDVSNPPRGTSVKEQALIMMAQSGGIARPLASAFVQAVIQGLDSKNSPKETRISTLDAIIEADKTNNQAIATEAGCALYQLNPHDPRALKALEKKLG